MKTQIEKKKVLAEKIGKELKEANTIILTDFRGLDTKKMQYVRALCKESGFNYKVVKNKILQKTLQTNDLSCINKYLVGPTAVAWGRGDVVQILKALFDFSKDEKNLKIKALYTEGKIFEEEEARKISYLPPKEQMLQKLILAIASPIINLQLQIKAPICILLSALGKVKEMKEVKR